MKLELSHDEEQWRQNSLSVSNLNYSTAVKCIQFISGDLKKHQLYFIFTGINCCRRNQNY